jgi:hypothetical protein
LSGDRGDRGISGEESGGRSSEIATDDSSWFTSAGYFNINPQHGGGRRVRAPITRRKSRGKDRRGTAVE